MSQVQTDAPGAVGCWLTSLNTVGVGDAPPAPPLVAGNLQVFPGSAGNRCRLSQRAMGGPRDRTEVLAAWHRLCTQCHRVMRSRMVHFSSSAFQPKMFKKTMYPHQK